MQSLLMQPASLPELPPTSLFSKWVLETPLPTALVMVLIGITVYVIVRHSPKRKNIGFSSLGIGFLCALTIMVMGQLITTPHEHLKERSTLLVHAVATNDAVALDALLDERVRLKTRFASATGKPAIIALTKSRAIPAIDSATTKEVRAGLYGPQVAKTHIKVRVQGDMIPSLSWWVIEWMRTSPDSADWVATRIEPLWIAGITNPAGAD